jgi:hypothetical protein
MAARRASYAPRAREKTKALSEQSASRKPAEVAIQDVAVCWSEIIFHSPGLSLSTTSAATDEQISTARSRIASLDFVACIFDGALKGNGENQPIYLSHSPKQRSLNVSCLK